MNLSDGGHFENLGLYELVRRRCRYIIACDADAGSGADLRQPGQRHSEVSHRYGSRDQLPLDGLRKLAEDGTVRAHGTVGTVRYPDGVVGSTSTSKTTVTRDETVDVLEYSLREPAFPHQSTSDQWFDESQFESYRKLGHHSIDATVHNVERRWPRQHGLQKLFDDLRALWRPATPSGIKAGRKHADAYDALLERIRRPASPIWMRCSFPMPTWWPKPRATVRLGKKSSRGTGGAFSVTSST